MKKRYIYATIFCTAVYTHASVLPYLEKEMNNLYISLLMHKKNIRHHNTYKPDYVEAQIDDIFNFTRIPFSDRKIDDLSMILEQAEELETKHTLILNRLEAIYGKLNQDEIGRYKENIKQLGDYIKHIKARKDNASTPATLKIDIPTLIKEIKDFQNSTLNKYDLTDPRVELDKNKSLSEDFITQSYQNALILQTKHKTIYADLTSSQKPELEKSLELYKRVIDSLNSDITSVLFIKNKRFPSSPTPSFSSSAFIEGLQLGDFKRAYEELDTKMNTIRENTSTGKIPDYSSLKDEIQQIVNKYINTFNGQLNPDEHARVRALEGELKKLSK